MTRDQDRLRRSTDAYHTLGRVAADIASRLENAQAGAAPQAPRRPGAQPGGSDGPADPVHSQVAQLEEHLRRRGGPLHRIGLLLTNLDDLAAALDAPHRLPDGFVGHVAVMRPSIRRGPVGARLHTVRAVADDIGQHLTLLNEAIYDTWRHMWRSGQMHTPVTDRPGIAYSAEADNETLLDRALLTYSAAASYADSICRSLEPYRPTVDNRPRCHDCGFRLIKYRRLELCNACYERQRRAAS